MPTDKQTQYACMNHYFFLATAAKYEGQRIIVCGENQETCRYARKNGVVHCTAAEGAANLERTILAIESMADEFS